MGTLSTIIDGINPAEIDIEGVVPTISGGSTMIQVVDVSPAEIEIEGCSFDTLLITGASVELILESPAEIEIEGGGTFIIGAEIIVPPAEIEVDGIISGVAYGVTVSPAEINVEGISEISVSGTDVEIVLEAPAEIGIESIPVAIFFTETYSIQVAPAEVEIEGIPTISFGAEIFLTAPAIINIAGSVPIISSEYYESITDGFFIWDYPVSQWEMQMSESLIVTDSLSPELVLIISDYFSFLDTLSTNQTGTAVISDSIIIRDLEVSWLRTISETISEAIILTDTPTAILILLVTDYIRVRESLSNNLTGTNSISETIIVTDSIVNEWLVSLVESIVLTDSVTAIRMILESLSENLTISDVLSFVGVYNVTISDNIKVSDKVQDIISLLISEGLVLTDTPTSLMEIYLSLSESLGMADALSASMDIYLSVSENIILIDSPSNTGILYSTIQEGISLNVTINIDNEIYECWVLNTPSFYPSVYTGFDFNSYCEFEGRAFGANATGIYELTGDDDLGSDIHTGVLLKETDFGMRNQKRFRKGYIGVDGDTPVMVMETDSGEREVYSISDSGKVNASRGIQGRDWTLSITEFDQLDSIELIPVILAKGR